jgi:hypothetical protein
MVQFWSGFQAWTRKKSFEAAGWKKVRAVRMTGPGRPRRRVSLKIRLRINGPRDLAAPIFLRAVLRSPPWIPARSAANSFGKGAGAPDDTTEGRGSIEEAHRR